MTAETALIAPNRQARRGQAHPPAAIVARSEGTILPLGASWIEAEQAYNFSLYAKHAESVVLLLFAEDDLARPLVEFRLDPRVNKTWMVWHCRLGGDVGAARYYAYRIDGPRAAGPGLWHAYDPEKVLLDPLAKEVFFPPAFDREAARRPGSNLGKAPLGVLPRPGPSPDPVPDRTPPLQPDTAIIYEMHVRGFTRNPNSGVPPERRGTFAGVIDKIPYLKELGITMVELLPVQQFDPQEGNYWGYMPLNFFAPHAGYASDARAARDEFRAMVRALHAADIQVILDVVYNHTAEAGPDGPTYSYRGIDNVAFYVMSDDPRAMYRDYTGCGNTLACASICTWTLILESLRYWVTEMHVDGFRFDLASVLARGPDGTLETADTSLLAAIRTDPILRHVHLIAEPWDAGWAYQLGTRFPGPGWCQWNGRFRDDVRRFVRGDPGMVGALMLRLYGSDDLFPDNPRDAHRPFETVNYVTCHDGFTLYDAVAYNEKRNWPNGHGNTDGAADNLSWNCGWEGDEDVPAAVMALRQRQAKNFFCLLMLANGVPMFAAGDEVPADSARQQQSLQPGQRDDLARLVVHRAACRPSSLREADDRLPQGASEPRPPALLARGRPLVRRRAGRRPVVRFAQPRLLPARCVAGRLRPLRHDQRVPRAARLRDPGEPAGRLASCDRHGARQPPRHRGTRARRPRWPPCASGSCHARSSSSWEETG